MSKNPICTSNSPQSWILNIFLETQKSATFRLILIILLLRLILVSAAFF